MTTHIVADDTLGTISRRMWEVQRRLLEGTLDPSLVAKNLQSIVEATEVSLAPLEQMSPFFADEEVKSNYGYPQGYAVCSILEQLLKLAPHFPNLDPEPTLKLYQQLPDLSSFIPETWMGRDVRRWVNWYIVPRRERVANTENEAVEKVIDLIGKTRTFSNHHKGNLGPKYLRLSERTAIALQIIGDKQKGDFLLIPAQFGLTHRGRSVRRVRVVYAPNEFGLGSFIAGCMILSHPERLVQWEQLRIDCPGDEYSPGADGDFSLAPLFYFYGGGVGFGAGWYSSAYGDYGSASAFVPA